MINQAPDAVLKVATKFLSELLPSVAWHNMRYGGIDREDIQIANAIIGAFWLYSLEWGSGYGIASWVYPFNELRRDGDFHGQEPWAILLQFAVEKAQTRTE